MQLLVTPEKLLRLPTESSDVTFTKSVSPRSLTVENLTFDALVGEPKELSFHLQNTDSVPHTPSDLHTPSKPLTSVLLHCIQDGDDDSMEGIEVDEIREVSYVLNESEDTEMSDEGDVSQRTPIPEEDVVCNHELVAEATHDDQSFHGPMDFRYDWLGTSQFSVEQTIAFQQEGELDVIITQREQVLEESQRHPYDPTPLLTLAYLDNRLGFCDIAVSNCHRALILINAAFNLKLATTPSNLGALAQKAISLRLNSTRVTLVGDEMLALRLQAYTTMVAGLFGCTAFWEGLKQCNVALKLYPGDHKLLQLKANLTDMFEQRSNDIPQDTDKKIRSAVLKTGMLFQRLYPWLDPKLFGRSQKLLRDINEEPAMKQGSLEIKRLFFGPNDERDSDFEVGTDVGPLGVFAKRDIEKGELIMVDKSITGVARPSSFEVCDACHACLSPPYIDPAQIVRPSCCKGAVSYCSKLCWDTARAAYHPLLCGRDFTWLYRNLNSDGKLGRRWRAVCFLRIIAIIITSNNKLPSAQRVHPLEHPLVARMTGAYTPRTLRPDNRYDWQFQEEVTIPTKILQVLGVDIFTSFFYTQEVIQTIYWRCENNANQTKSRLEHGLPEVNLININTSYLFFNHSCLPNVQWQGPLTDGIMKLDSGIEGEFVRPGESAVWCVAVRHIKKGEQCTISYIGNASGEKTIGESRALKRSMLSKWCENGCGCTICEEENKNGVGGTEDAQEEVPIGGGKDLEKL